MATPRIRSRFAELPPYRVHFLQAGDGPPLLLIPSMLVMARSYRPLIKRLSRHFQVWVPELPGCGLSSRVREPLSFEGYARVALRFLESQGLQRALWIGHSNSGPVVIHAALQSPDRVERLILADTIGGAETETLPRVLGSRFIDALLEPRLTLRGTPHVLWNLTRHRRSFVTQIRLAARERVHEPLSRVTPPVLLAWGTRDHTEPEPYLRRLSAALPQAQVVHGRGSHDWLIEGRKQFTRCVLDFASKPHPARR